MLQEQVEQAVRAGMDLDAIEQTIIEPAKIDEDQKAALWLYAEVLEGRRNESMLIAEERPLIEA
jgi:hypothetical protein